MVKLTYFAFLSALLFLLACASANAKGSYSPSYIRVKESKGVIFIEGPRHPCVVRAKALRWRGDATSVDVARFIARCLDGAGAE